MKKIFKIKPFGTNSGKDSDELIIAFRRERKLFIQNLELVPEDRFKIAHVSQSGLISIEIRLAENECLVLGSEGGIAVKKQIEG